jgi:hypothetical protein
MSDTLVFPDPSSSKDNSKDSKDSKSNSSSSSSDSSKAHSKPNAGTAAATPDAAGATVASFAEASAATAKVRPTLLSKDAQRKLQPAYRRRFESYMRANGYVVRTTRRGTFVSQQTPQQAQQNAQNALRFSSTDASAAPEGVAAAMPAGVESAPEQPLVCVACRANMISVGGFIGGSYCMPCEPGTSPNSDRSACGE